MSDGNTTPLVGHGLPLLTNRCVDIQRHVSVASDGHIVDTTDRAFTFPMFAGSSSFEGKVDSHSGRSFADHIHSEISLDGAELL